MAGERKTLMRNLGAFVGHIVHAVRNDGESDRRVVRKDVEEKQAKNGVVYRRTTIDEIETPADAQANT